MTSNLIYDVCVVGAGLWGSSAAYHLALLQEKKICLIGPNEPSTKEYPRTSIFGAHYDEGRISRMNVGSLTEAILVDRSTEKYPEIQKRTGIQFFTEGENVNFGATGSPYIFKSKNVSEIMKLQHLLLSRKEVSKRCPYLNIPMSNQCVLQLTKAGIINPRKYLLSMKTSAHMRGCDIFEEVVDDISEYHLSDGSTELILTTDNGNKIRARKVLLCTGVFTSFKNLLPDHLQPDIIMAPEQTLRMELSEDDLKLLKDMPSITSLTKTNPCTDCYILPPVSYPDGKMYLKIGHDDLDFILETKEDAIAWYRGNGCPKLKSQLKKMIDDIMPGIKPRSRKTDTCISTLTRSEFPYCDMVTPTIGIMVGGNAVGARMAYEMGRIGARMILKGHWDHDLPASQFKIHYYKNKAKL